MRSDLGFRTSRLSIAVSYHNLCDSHLVDHAYAVIKLVQEASASVNSIRHRPTARLKDKLLPDYRALGRPEPSTLGLTSRRG